MVKKPFGSLFYPIHTCKNHLKTSVEANKKKKNLPFVETLKLAKRRRGVKPRGE
jgi:hypothetical protein